MAEMDNSQAPDNQDQIFNMNALQANLPVVEDGEKMITEYLNEHPDMINLVKEFIRTVKPDLNETLQVITTVDGLMTLLREHQGLVQIVADFVMTLKKLIPRKFPDIEVHLLPRSTVVVPRNEFDGIAHLQMNTFIGRLATMVFTDDVIARSSMSRDKSLARHKVNAIKNAVMAKFPTVGEDTVSAEVGRVLKNKCYNTAQKLANGNDAN